MHSFFHGEAEVVKACCSCTEKDDELAEKISRIAFLEKEQRDYKEAAVTTLHYPKKPLSDGDDAVPETVATVIVDVAPSVDVAPTVDIGDIFQKVLDGVIVSDERHLDFNSL